VREQPAEAAEPAPGGGATSSQEAPGAGGETAPSADAFVLMGLLPPGDDRATIRAALGEPTDSAREVVPNRHVPGVMDTLIVLEYPGLAVHLHRPGLEDAGDLLSEVEVTDPRWLRYARPSIGTELSELESLLGRPTEIDGDGFTYSCGSCEMAETSVEFVIAGNRVTRVRFLYYVD
jgi:hypothetical protein